MRTPRTIRPLTLNLPEETHDVAARLAQKMNITTSEMITRAVAALARIGELEQRARELEEQKREAQKQGQQAGEKIESLTAMAGEREQSIAGLKQQLSRTVRQQRMFALNFKTYRTRAVKLEDRIAELRKERDETAAKFKELEEKNHQLTDAFEQNEEIRQLRRECAESLAWVEQLEKKLEAEEAESARLRHAVYGLKTQRTKAETRKKKIKEIIRRKTREYRTLLTHCDSLRGKWAQALKREKDLLERLRAANKEISARDHALIELRAKRADATSMLKELAQLVEENRALEYGLTPEKKAGGNPLPPEKEAGGAEGS